jgi:hypothetical protein
MHAPLVRLLCAINIQHDFEQTVIYFGFGTIQGLYNRTGKFHRFFTLKMEPIGCPETSVIIYPYSIRNNTEEFSPNPRWETDTTKEYNKLYHFPNIFGTNSVMLIIYIYDSSRFEKHKWRRATISAESESALNRGRKENGKLKKINFHKFPNPQQARTGRNMVIPSNANAPSS